MGLRHPVLDDRRRNLVQCPLAEGRIELLVQVRTVRSAGRDLEVLVGQPLLFDVVPEGDLAQTPVVPRARENLLLLAVGGSQGLTTGRVRAGRALGVSRFSRMTGLQLTAFLLAKPLLRASAALPLLSSSVMRFSCAPLKATASSRCELDLGLKAADSFA